MSSNFVCFFIRISRTISPSKTVSSCLIQFRRDNYLIFSDVQTWNYKERVEFLEGKRGD